MSAKVVPHSDKNCKIKIPARGAIFGVLKFIEVVNDGPASRQIWKVLCLKCRKMSFKNKYSVINIVSGCCMSCAKTQENRNGDLPEYAVWEGMKQRCLNPNCVAYKDYGGRGIVVCEEWKEFENFYRDMGSRPTPKHTLEREDNDKGYEPSNCRWATRKEQSRNRRKGCHFITYNGQTKTITEWSEIVGINPKMLGCRILRGWDIEKAMNTPIGESEYHFKKINDKYCLACGKKLVRHIERKTPESPSGFNKRKTCGIECGNILKSQNR